MPPMSNRVEECAKFWLLSVVLVHLTMTLNKIMLTDIMAAGACSMFNENCFT